MVRLLVKTAILVFAGMVALLSEWFTLTRPMHAALGRWTATGVERVARTMGQPTYLDARSVHGFGYSVLVTPECDGLVAAVLLVTGVTLLSLPWRRKLLLFLLVIPGVFAANVARIVTILLIGTRNEQAADILHEIVFPVGVTLVLGVLWVRWLSHEAPRPSESTPR